MDAELNEVGLIYLQDLMKTNLGFDLDVETKKTMAEARLRKLSRRSKLDYSKLIQSINNESLPTHLKRSVIEYILTYETYFFRERYDIETLVKDIGYNPARSISICSMGCSTGQEPYSILMMLKKYLPKRLPYISIVGTDVSKKALQKAKDGIYTTHDIMRANDPDNKLMFNNFTSNGKDFVISKELRDKLSLKYQVLISYKDDTKYDYIFAENIMIYFTKQARFQALNNIINNSMRIGSKLFLGSSEIVNDRRLKIIKNDNRSYYEKIYD